MNGSQSLVSHSNGYEERDFLGCTVEVSWKLLWASIELHGVTNLKVILS